MGLSIFSFVLEQIVSSIVSAAIDGGTGSVGILWFFIIGMAISVVLSAVGTKISIRQKNEESTGKGVTGMIFGIIGIVEGSVAMIIILIYMAILL